MSLNRGTNKGSNQDTSMGAAYSAEQNRQQSQQGQAADSSQDFNDLRDLGAFYDLPAAANLQSEVLTRLRGSIERQIKENNDPIFDVTLVGMDNTDPSLRLRFSALALCVSLKNRKNIGIGYHTLLIEASAPALEPIVVPMQGGRSVELIRTTGDAWDNVMRGEVNRELARLNPNTPLFSGEARVIPRDFNIDDQGIIKRLSADAITAAGLALVRSKGNFEDVNLGKYATDSTLTLNIAFQQPQSQDSVGNPVRGDVKLDFRAGSTVRQNAPGRSLNEEKATELSTILGYVDFIHQRQQQQNQWMPQQPQLQPGQDPNQVNPLQQYFARFVITQLRSSNRPTLGQQILALAMVSTLRRQGAWYPQFKPNYAQQGELDLRDVGVLGIETLKNPETGLGQRLNTKINTFKPSDLGAFLNMVVKPGLIVSMDIPECGDDTFLNSIFAEAGTGDAKATATLFDATNVLTNGEFEKHYQRGAPICFNENDRIQNGHYIAGDGRKHDGREIDYVAMMNIAGERDLTLVRDWHATFIQTEFPIEQRLEARHRIEKELNPSLQVTGYSARVTFEDQYLRALTLAVAATNLQVREISPFNDTAGYDLPRYQFGDRALGGYVQSPLFQQGFAAPNQSSPFGRSGRWS
jgi:hypothetical protein